MDELISEDRIFNELSFSKQWVDTGIVTADSFTKIKKEYLKGEDRNAEHYRWGAFKAFIKKNDLIDTDKFYTIYGLAKNDPDYAMGRAMIFEISKRSDCPEKLIDTVIEDAVKKSDKSLLNHALKCKAKCDRPSSKP
jgi:hypothetical protein